MPTGHSYLLNKGIRCKTGTQRSIFRGAVSVEEIAFLREQVIGFIPEKASDSRGCDDDSHTHQSEDLQTVLMGTA